MTELKFIYIMILAYSFIRIMYLDNKKEFTSIKAWFYGLVLFAAEARIILFTI